MYKVSIPFKDYFGNEHEKDYTFSLTSSEILELEADTNGGLRSAIKDLGEGRDPKDLTKFFSILVKASYGEISEDGMIFDKSQKVWDAFHQSPAYDVFFMMLMTKDSTAINFLNGILPKEEE